VECLLGKIGDKRAINPIIKFLDKKDSETRDHVFEALAGFGVESIEELSPLLQNKDKDIKIRTIKLFGDMGDAKAVKPLFSVLIEKDVKVYNEVFEALSKIGEPSISAIIASFKIPNKDIKVAAAKTLIDIGEPAVKNLISALKDEDYSIRWLSAATLCKVKDSPMVNVLIESLTEDSLETVSWAYPFYILVGIPDTDVILVKTIQQHGNAVMAEDFMNSGNEKLYEAALEWAKNNGYEVEQQESSVGTPRWGSAPK
jgi:HEAT repeat protein